MSPYTNAEVLDHVLCTSLPWRGDERTECGRAVTAVAQTITRDELRTRLQQWARARTAMTVCMICAQRANYAGSWETNPLAVFERELQRAGGSALGYVPPETDESRRMCRALHAIVALITAHRDGFDAYVDLSLRPRVWIGLGTVTRVGPGVCGATATTVPE